MRYEGDIYRPPGEWKLYDTVTGIQWGKLEDKFGWIVPVC